MQLIHHFGHNFSQIISKTEYYETLTISQLNSQSIQYIFGENLTWFIPCTFLYKYFGVYYKEIYLEDLIIYRQEKRFSSGIIGLLSEFWEDQEIKHKESKTECM